MVCVTSVDICKGSFHIYRTMCELWAPEGLLKLDHTPYGGFTSQGSTRPIFTLGSSSCQSTRLYLNAQKLTEYSEQDCYFRNTTAL